MALAAQLGRPSDQALVRAWLCTLLLRTGRYAALLVQAKAELPLLTAPAVVCALAADRRALLWVVRVARPVTSTPRSARRTNGCA